MGDRQYVEYVRSVHTIARTSRHAKLLSVRSGGRRLEEPAWRCIVIGNGSSPWFSPYRAAAAMGRRPVVEERETQRLPGARRREEREAAAHRAALAASAEQVHLAVTALPAVRAVRLA